MPTPVSATVSSSAPAAACKVTVTAPNRPPSVSIDDLAGLIGASFSGVATVVDPDGDTVTCTADGLVEGVTWDNATRTLSDARLTYYRTVFSQRQSVLELTTAAGMDVLDSLAGDLTCRVSPTNQGAR